MTRMPVLLSQVKIVLLTVGDFNVIFSYDCHFLFFLVHMMSSVPRETWNLET